MTCRKTSNEVEPGIETLSREAAGGRPVYSSTGVRHEGGVSVIQVSVSNGETCRPDRKGDAQVGSPRMRQSPRRGTGTTSLVVGMNVL